jgi:hypothetical protein
MPGLLEFEVAPRTNLRSRRGVVRTEPIRRTRRQCLEVNDPGIPGADNWWCPSHGQARGMALRRASALGPGYRIVHDRRPIRGWPHYHVVAPAGDRVSGHYFYGGRQPHRLYRDRPWREFEFALEFELTPGGGKDHFVIETRDPILGRVIVPAGHEVLTRQAAAGLSLSGAEVDALVEGVRRPDTAPLWEAFYPGEQMRHALRRELCTGMRAALAEIRNHLVGLHGNAMRAGSRRDALRWVGEALHLIQDSFSEAHTERLWRTAGPPHPIRFIRYFGPQGRAFPDEHRVIPPPDPRDIITGPGGGLTFAAAQSVAASRGFLQMMLRHLARPSAPGNAAELRAFMDRHLVLTSSPREPSSWYSRCP